MDEHLESDYEDKYEIEYPSWMEDDNSYFWDEDDDEPESDIMAKEWDGEGLSVFPPISPKTDIPDTSEDFTIKKKKLDVEEMSEMEWHAG